MHRRETKSVRLTATVQNRPQPSDGTGSCLFLTIITERKENETLPTDQKSNQEKLNI